MLDEFEFSVCMTFIQHAKHKDISFIRILKMADSALMVVVLNELVDSDDEKPTRGKTRNWVKRREEKGYFSTIIKEIRMEDSCGFREIPSLFGVV